MIQHPDDLTELTHVEPSKRRIYVLFQGFLTREQAVELRDAYRSAIARVGPGFTVLSYFKSYSPGKEDVQEIITSMIRMASQGGCRKAARVGAGGPWGPLQLHRLSAQTEATYPTRNFDTWEEAEAYLDSEED